MRKYKKTIWNSGDIITDEKMNNIINGMASTSLTYQLPIILDNENIIINKSFDEILELSNQGIICYFLLDISAENNNNDMYGVLILARINKEDYTIHFRVGNYEFGINPNNNNQMIYPAPESNSEDPFVPGPDPGSGEIIK